MRESGEFKKYLITIVYDFFYKHFYIDGTLLTKRSARFVLSMHFYLSVLIGVVYPRHKEDRMGAEGGKGWRREPAGRNIMFSLGRDHYLAQLNKRANATGRIAHTY